MQVDLRIDELILEGLPAGEREQVGEALRAELARLFVEHGVPPGLLSGGAVPQLDGGAVELAPGIAPNAVGARMARAVYRSLHTR